jgi:hypothetical protein
MRTFGHPHSDALVRRRIMPTSVRARVARRLGAAIALGAVLVPSMVDAAPSDTGATETVDETTSAETTSAETTTAETTIDDATIFDELSLTEVIETLADDDFSFDGRNILVEDPAPLGPHHHEPDAAPEAIDGGSGTNGPVTAIGFTDAFSLNSRPSATHSIFLDFDGHTVSGTPWNASVATINAGRYRREPANQPDTGFTQLELNGIHEIWMRVAEDFAAWDVNVTTEDPGVDALMRSGFGDQEYGIRTIITPDYQWYSSQQYGGVAYLRSFSRSSDLPAWVFSSNLGTGNPKSVAEAVSHEVGHTLGLQHDGHDDGSSSSSYYSGHGNWAPIMGVGYYREVTQWSDGSYPGATNTEDDLAIIDEFIDRLPLAAGGAGLPATAASTTTHVLGESGATQTHSLTVTQGPVSIGLDKLEADGNLLAALTVRDPAGQIVGSASPLHPAAWSLTVDLPPAATPGTYTVEVRGMGWAGSGSSDPGFSAYGSIGGYTLSVQMPNASTTTAPPPPSDGPTSPPPSAPPPSTSSDPTDPPSRPSSDTGDRLQPVDPLRVLDTRSASSPTDGRLRSGQNLKLDLPTAPDGSTAAVINVVAAAPTGTGWLSVTPCTALATTERTSSINFTRGLSIANSIIAPMTANGEICVYASTATHVVIDVTGWIGNSGTLTLDQVGSDRVIDTRIGLGIPQRLRAGTTTEIDLSGDLSGADIGAVALSVTAIRPTTRGYITIDNCAGSSTISQHATSSLNVATRENRSNNGIFALGSGQRLCISTTTTTHVTIDVTGEFGAGNGLRFVAASPSRVLDTRGQGALSAGASTSFHMPTAEIANAFSTLPSAASVNLTAARPEARGFVTAWDCGQRPETSALNPTADASTASGALVPLSDSGQTCLFHSTGGHLIVDLAGWWI